MSTLTLALPNNYVEIEQEEMMYLEGGGTLTLTLTLKVSFLRRVCEYSAAAIGAIIGGLIGLSSGPVVAVFAGAIGATLGGIIRGTVAASMIKNDKKLSISNILLPTKSWTLS